VARGLRVDGIRGARRADDGWWKVRFNSDWTGYSPEFNDHLSYDTWAEPGGLDQMPGQANVGMGPYAAIILSQDG
jgi:1,4-alpha-glucan branching enzyme